MDLLTTLYKVGTTDVEYGAISCNDQSVSVILTKAAAIKAFVAATGNVGFIDIRFASTRKDGSEYLGIVGAAAAPTRVSRDLSSVLEHVFEHGYMDCTDIDGTRDLKVRPVKAARMSTDGEFIWFSGLIDNAVVETTRIPIEALDV